MKLLKIVSIFGLLLLARGFAGAQNPLANKEPVSEVKCTFQDAAGAVIPGTEVILKATSGQKVLQTGLDGTVVVQLPSGKYSVTASKAEFATNTMDVEIVAPKPVSFAITLQVDDVCCGDGFQPEILTIPSELPDSVNQTASRYSTLAIEYLGKTNRPVFPVVITTSSKEGNWYAQNVFGNLVSEFVRVYTVRASILSEITKFPSLQNGLAHPPRSEQMHKKSPTVNFVAGRRHEYVQSVLDARTSVEILQEIERHVVDYPALEGQIREIENLTKQQSLKQQ